MINDNITPLNISLLVIPDRIRQVVQPVSSLDIYDGSTSNFHPQGLYSTEIFGIVGTPQRMTKYSWIDIRLNVLHPALFFALCKLKGLYAEIVGGKTYAVFDEREGDFVKSTPENGQTGYHFFFENHKKIKHKRTNSPKRDELIKFVQTKREAELNAIYVLPAGYRDIVIEDGRESSDEVNSLYYKLIAISNTIQPEVAKTAPEMFNAQRMSMQNAVCEIYTMMLRIIRGKNNAFMGRWMSRNVFGTTRNVLTAIPFKATSALDATAISMNDTGVGIFQLAASTMRETIFGLKTGFLSEVFPAPGAEALLTDKKTLKSKRVKVKNKTYDRWMTVAGLRRVIATYASDEVKWRDIDIEGNYLGLVYRGPDGTFRFVHGVDELPEGRLASDCLPITLTELLYVAMYLKSRDYIAHVTRYPVASDFSTYPSIPLLISTVKQETRTPLDIEWQPMPAQYVAAFFPVRHSRTFNAMAPHPCRHEKLGADHDGDTGSFMVCTSREAVEEGKAIFSMAKFYLDAQGNFAANLENDTVVFVTKALTGA